MLATLAISSLAFSGPAARPAAGRASSVNMMAKSKALPFLEAPPATDGLIGSQGFDPLKCSEYVNVKYLQEAEIKHGRLAMLAVVGFIAVDLGITGPGAPTGLSSVAAHDVAIEKGGMVVLLIVASVLELCGGVPKVFSTLGGTGEPGNYGFDPLNLGAKGGERMQLAEIKNGRLAMLAFSGMVTQAVLYEKGFPYF